MGSFGDSWLSCTWCQKKGMNCGEIPDDVAILCDIDGIGLLCELCQVRQWPPHYDYVEKLLGAAKLGGKYQVYAIADFAYPICAEVHSWKGD